jgi:uncharacterized protein YyaL (SSP411 family)
MNSSHRNRLNLESSPYLLQHAENPVDWYPWGEEALERARREDKPILLSIGYSACHWCHVMAHESFEDAATAALMNDLFVNIKVDREERPDLDKIYQFAHQVMVHRSGGWPLTMFLNPHNHIPFFGGTYFPKVDRYQLPAFTTLLRRVAEYYHQQKSELQAHHQSFDELLHSLRQESDSGIPNPSLLMAARRELAANFDFVHGGFGGAPKFPHVSELKFLLRQWCDSKNQDHDALQMLVTSLVRMAEGGIYDAVGGGFYRYSVDAAWQIPHFEKMLYDNSILISLYATTWQTTKNPLFKIIVEETAGWILREMRSSEGGFYAALDADSEGKEGKYYVWNRQEIRALLTDAEYGVIEPYYGLDQTPNFEGHWHLHVTKSLSEIAHRLGLTSEVAEELFTQGRNKLFKAREQRIRPGLDDKILTAWNALIIQGLATAGRILQRSDFIAAAGEAFDFLRRRMCDKQGRLLATYKNGQARYSAYLDDYAFLLDASLELLQCRWDSDELQWLMMLADQLLARFEDAEHGGFFFTASDHEPLLYRPKSWMDESMPTGNGMAASALLRLGHLVGESRFIDAVERTFRSAHSSMHQYPTAHGSLLLALAEWLAPSRCMILRGPVRELENWQEALRRSDFTNPFQQIYTIPEDAANLPGLLAKRKPFKQSVAYVCTGRSCLAPLVGWEEFQRFLES